MSPVAPQPHSLVEATRVSREKVDDLISAPAILIFIFVVRPFFMIYVPYLAYTLVTENLLVSIQLTACLAAAAYLLERFYFRKA